MPKTAKQHRGTQSADECLPQTTGGSTPRAAAVYRRQQSTGGGCNHRRRGCGAGNVGVPMRAAAHDGTKHRISSGGTESSTTTRCALETWSMLVAETAPHDRMPSGRQAAVATDDMRETARSMSPAADTTRQRRGACAQPVADSVQLPAAPHVASMRPCLAASGVDAELRYAPAPSQTKTASERGCGQPHLACEAA
jgi:hypothetical protein